MKKRLTVVVLLSSMFFQFACSTAPTGDEGYAYEEGQDGDAYAENGEYSDDDSLRYETNDTQEEVVDSANVQTNQALPEEDAYQETAEPALAQENIPEQAPVEPVQAPEPELAVEPPSNPYSENTQSAANTYLTKSGDTLMKIAFEQYGDIHAWKKIYELNKSVLSSPSVLTSGISLVLDTSLLPISISRNGDQYLIQIGDTLGSISKNLYGQKKYWKALWKNNPELIKDPNKIYAGFTLYYQPITTMEGTSLGSLNRNLN